jgi:ribosome-associated translation inhibitor RaiA/cold shock CspA family protein
MWWSPNSCYLYHDAAQASQSARGLIFVATSRTVFHILMYSIQSDQDHKDMPMNSSLKSPVHIVFRNLGQSDAVEAKVRERAEKLGNFYSPIMSCEVVVESLHRHHEQGNHFHVRVDVRVPQKELVAGREPDEHHSYTDVYVAIRDAFDSMRRQLEEHARHQQGKVKVHETAPHGRIAELYPEINHGRIETSDGRLVYFHRNSVIDADFDKLEVGADVRFNEEMGEDGPQASSVQVVGKHHIVG